MHKKPAYILSTRSLGEEAKNLVAATAIILDEIDFIQVSLLPPSAWLSNFKEHIPQESLLVITSQHSVKALKAYAADLIPEGQHFACVGEQTKQLTKANFPNAKILYCTANADDLASEIISADKPMNIIYCCGNIRRENLPAMLKHHGLNYIELIVYKTQLTPHTPNDKYDGILWFSPSAVLSFFSTNTVNTDVVMFAIGDTTEKALADSCFNKIITATEPNKIKLLQTAITYFKQ